MEHEFLFKTSRPGKKKEIPLQTSFSILYFPTGFSGNFLYMVNTPILHNQMRFFYCWLQFLLAEHERIRVQDVCEGVVRGKIWSRGSELCSIYRSVDIKEWKNNWPDPQCMASSAQQDITLFPVPDPDLEIRVDPVSQKFFSALRASVWCKNKRGVGRGGLYKLLTKRGRCDSPINLLVRYC